MKNISLLFFCLICNFLCPVAGDGSKAFAQTGRNVNALWGKIDYNGRPWVANTSKKADFTNGLGGRHLSLWASHGRYYDNDKGIWKWQRPFLFCTTEDLFTQTIVVPFLIPMLENAGAIVFTPRERDWQTDEYIVDPDGGLGYGSNSYEEYYDKDAWTATDQPGFAAHNGNYQDNENPFAAGKARQVKSTKKAGKSFIVWKPDIVKTGRYAVYVSYQTLEKSVDDAHYTVFHQGIPTEFSVNQRMGGGTWVYLGTFDFDKGCSVDNCVMLTNQSKRKGVVTADAVRFGGGMGNIYRGSSTSGYPRALEGSRYYAQWAGAPYSVYGGRKGINDYADDINTRSLMTNWLAGGSVFNPTQDGLHVPIELSLAVHSDAGFARNGKNIWGSLAICTTDFNDGRLASGVTRQCSKLFASMLLENVTNDLNVNYPSWTKRYLWDRNYSETRLPAVPSAILETMSHQNFPDMVLGQDPNFRFDLARSIYKTIARFVNGMHGNKTVIEPLSPQNLFVDVRKGHATLGWTARNDKTEPSATPDYFMVYTAIGKGGFDNGMKVKGTSVSVDIEPGVPYHFKVTAVNKGGESFPTEVVSAVYEPKARQTILIVNGFHRLSAPSAIDNATQQGFDIKTDIGVSYGVTAGWSGMQTNFDRSRMGIEGSTGLGYSGNELAGRFIAGNDFNYICTHAAAIASAHKYNVASCSSHAVETGRINMNKYNVVDLLLGLERYNPYSVRFYKTFTPSLQQHISEYLSIGGRMLVSGAYIASDMNDDKDNNWLRQTLSLSGNGQLSSDSLQYVSGMGLNNIRIYNTFNADHYSVQQVDRLQTEGEAFSVMQYNDGTPAAIANNGAKGKSVSIGFPFECIIDEATRNNIMRGLIAFLLK